MYMTFLVFSVLMSLVSYLMFDPIKSSFFLIFSMLFLMPVLSFSGFIWFSYFICLLFLSGIFVILVYFSSLSKLVFLKFNLFVLLFFLSFFNLFYFISFQYFLSLNTFYFFIYISLLIFILLNLLIFMSFSSYFLNFSGALRKF